ncbi:MAG: hypothetical protein M3024_07175 [Candidatus Dormibacteraeota bacterium]|nr:hypothetical protein [Candidatus Dormibacteraeota bacterium]
MVLGASDLGERYREALRAGRDLDRAMSAAIAAELRYAAALRELEEAAPACGAPGIELAGRALGEMRAV